MTVVRAEEYTQALGQVVSGSWRQIARAKKLGVPQALGLSLEDWVTSRLGGYIKLSIPDRREAVRELAAEGLSNVAVGQILGVDETTVRRDSANAEKSRRPAEKNNGLMAHGSAKAEPPKPPSPLDKFGRTATEIRDDEELATSVARAHAAVVAVLPVLGASERLEFHACALSLASDVRRIGDGETLRLAEELCRELADRTDLVGV
jgi:hypothetical protein